MTPDLVSTSYSFTSGASVDVYLCHGQAGEWKLVGLSVVSSATVSGSTNKFELAVTETAGGTTVATTLATASSTLTVGVAKQLTMSEAGAAREFGPTDSVKCNYDESGTLSGVNYQIVCQWQKARV